jgi:ribosomal protein L19E
MMHTSGMSMATFSSAFNASSSGEFRSVAELERYINENNLRRRTFG